MNMKFLWLGVRQKHPRVMIEFNYNDRVLYPVVKGVFIVEASDPREVRLVFEGQDVLDPQFARLFG